MSLSAILSRFGGGQTSAANAASTSTAATQPAFQPVPQNNVPPSLPPAELNKAGQQQQQSAEEAKQFKLEDFAPAFAPQNDKKPQQSAEPDRFYPDFTSPDFRKSLTDNVKFDHFFNDQVFSALQSGNVQEFRNAMNAALQTAMLYTFAGLGKLTEEGLNKRLSGLDTQIESKLNRTKIESALSTHPVLSNPALAPVRQALTESFSSKYPQAAPDQIQAFVNEYLLTLANTVNPPKSDKPVQQAEQDWSKFL